MEFSKNSHNRNVSRLKCVKKLKKILATNSYRTSSLHCITPGDASGMDQSVIPL